MTATRFFGDCTDKNLGNQALCKAHGCQWKNSECVNLNCTTSTTTLCAKEQINSFGNVLICELANSLCVETNSTSIKKENCDKMTAHTFDTAASLCKPCKSLEKYLINLERKAVNTT